VADIRAKALSYLRSGSVTVLAASSQTNGPLRPYFVKAVVVGHVAGHGWACTCRRGEPGACAHVAAVALTTGHDTPARPNTTKESR
jgi:uncharacterized Zn finger protein